MKFFLNVAFVLGVVFNMAQTAPEGTYGDLRIVKATPAKPVTPPRPIQGRREDNSVLLESSMVPDEREADIKEKYNDDLRGLKGIPDKPVPPPRGGRGRKEDNSVLLEGSMVPDEREADIQEKYNDGLRKVKAPPGKAIPPSQGGRGRKEN